MRTRRIGLLVALVMVTTVLTAQDAFNERALRALGLDAEEAQKVLEIHEEASLTTRRLGADLAVKKAELTRLLLEENPNMRQVEQTLRESSAIEVDIRLAEIRREIAVREVVGTNRWARMMQTVRSRQAQAAGEIGTEVSRRLRDLQTAIDEKQRALAELIRGRRDLAGSEEIRDAFRELQEQYLELQRVIREQM